MRNGGITCSKCGMFWEAYNPPASHGEKHLYRRVSHDGAEFTDTPENVINFLKLIGPDETYNIDSVYMTECEFKFLPEFEGF